MNRSPGILSSGADRIVRLPCGLTLACALALIASGVVATSARAAGVVWSGRIVDAAGAPLEGHRVVARMEDAIDVRVSEPSDAAGRYRLEVPAEREFAIIAVYDPRGRREEIDPVRPEGTGTAERWLDVRLRSATHRDTGAAGRRAPAAEPGRPAAVEPAGEPSGGGGATSRRAVARGSGPDTMDRLLLGWVQEPIVVNRQHWEIQVERTDLDIAEQLGVSVIGAWRTPWFRRVELGGRLGYAGNDETIGARSGSGFTDTELWIKGALSDPGGSNPVVGWGGTVVLPTGDGAEARGEDALGLSGFASARFPMRNGVRLTGYAGLGWTEDGQLGGLDLGGRFAPFAGGGAVMKLSDALSAVGELRWQERRYDELDTDLRALGAVNWEALPVGVARLGLGIGLADGAPDWQVIAGYAFDY